MNEKCLIVNADDFGMSRGITDGILLAHNRGFLTSTSLMVNMPAAEYAVAQLATTPVLGVGVHLNICDGRPILPASEVPTLVNASGNFHSAPMIIRKLWLWQISRREIEAEFRAQLRWAKDRGVVPTHADSHHHTHIYPAAAIPFARALAAEGVYRARSPRCGVWPATHSLGGPHEGNITRRVLVRAYRSSLCFTVFRNIAMPQSRVSFLSHVRHDLNALGEKWKAAFESLPTGFFELACHPGIFEAGFSESDGIHAQREAELNWLTHGDWLRAVEKAGIRLVTYNALSREHAIQPVAAEVQAL